MAEEYQKRELYQYLRIVRQKSWLLILSTLGVVSTFFFWTNTRPKIYQASCKIQLTESYDKVSLLGFSPLYYSPSNFRESEAEVIKSNLLAAKVVESLKKKGVLPKKLSDKNLERLSSEIKAKTYVRPIGKTNIIEIIYRGLSPEFTCEVALALGEEYIKLKEIKKKKRAQELCEFIAKQIKVVENVLREAEESLRNFKRKNKIVALDDEIKGVISTLKTYELESLKLNLQSEEIKFELARLPLKMKKPKEIYFLNSLLNSSFIKKLNEKLVNLQLELLVISQQYQPSHPKIEMLLSQIEAIERKLNTLLTSAQKNLPEVQREVLSQYIQLKARLEILETKQQALSKIKAALNRQLASLLDNELEYVRLERRKEINKRIYTMLLEREQEARISETTTQPGAVIVDYPSLPTRPIAPNMKTNLILGAIMGIILGGFLIAGSEYLDTSVKNIEEVDRLLKCPILGFIPHTNSRARNSERPLQSKLLIHQSPSFKEAYETLQTNIKFIIPHNHHKRILITSAIPREGKSLTAVNLALVSASVGTPTAVLESDLRRAILHHTFEIDSKPGVTDFIIDKKIPLEAIIKPTRVKNLFLLPCGTPAPNPPELLSSPRMKEILERISLKFPTVVLDTPPVVAVIDAVVLGGLVDCVLVVVELGRTPVDQILHLKNAFKKANVAIKGVVVNNIRLNGYYAPYGGYLQYYRYYYTEKPPKGRRKRMSGIFKRLFTK